MIRPFMSSDGSSTTVTVVSAVWLAATRWSASATSARARRFASLRASSSSWRTVRASSCRTRSSDRSSRCCFASLTVRPEMRCSSPSACVLRRLQLLLQRLQVGLAVGDPLLAPRQLGELGLELLLALEHTLLELHDLRAAVAGSRASISPRSLTACSRASIWASRRSVSASRWASPRSLARDSSARRSRDPLTAAAARRRPRARRRRAPPAPRRP